MSSSPELENYIGIERAFDVLRNHTVHTKGYVQTALKMIEEFGSPDDKDALLVLLKEKNDAVVFQKDSKTAAKKTKPVKVSKGTKR